MYKTASCMCSKSTHKFLCGFSSQALASMAISCPIPFKPCFPPLFWTASYRSSLCVRARFFCSSHAHERKDSLHQHTKYELSHVGSDKSHWKQNAEVERMNKTLQEFQRLSSKKLTQKSSEGSLHEYMNGKLKNPGRSSGIRDHIISTSALAVEQDCDLHEAHEQLHDDATGIGRSSKGAVLEKVNGTLLSQDRNSVHAKSDDLNQVLKDVGIGLSSNGVLMEKVNGTLSQDRNNVHKKSDDHNQVLKDAGIGLSSNGVLMKKVNGTSLSQDRNNVHEKAVIDDHNQFLGDVEIGLSSNGVLMEKVNGTLMSQDRINELEKTVTDGHDQFLEDAQKGLSVNGLSSSEVCEEYSLSQEELDQSKLRWRLYSIYNKVLIVDNVTTARRVVDKLMQEYRDHVHACDTEVSKIDVKQETPVNHGEIICFSIYSGQNVDYGDGKSCIWVDVLDGGGDDILAVFAPFFEDSSIKKVWHNYSFDCHVVENYGIKLSGFHADTMHMARLWNSSRRIEGGYSLEALTSDPRVMNESRMVGNEDLIGKISMKTIFGRRNMKKDGSLGKIVSLPSVEMLQVEERKPWICYSSLDSMSTLKLYESLKSKLTKMPWVMNGKCVGNMLHFYENYWRPFGELLAQMETEGMLVNRTYLSEIEKVAIAEQQIAADRFRNWASKYCPDARYMNVGSDTQLRQLFFGGFSNRKDDNEFLPTEKKFKIPNSENVIEEGKKTPKKFRDITLHKIGNQLQTDLYTASGWPSLGGDALKALAGKVSAEYVFSSEASDLEALDAPQTSDNLDVDLSTYGTAFAAFDGGREGMEACHAIAALCEMCSIDSLISNFILPLQGSHIAGKDGRIHCSLNINTETGRLSARRPNLQNQPALEKDRYKIRQAFVATPGNSLIVADYGQLELRILAHLADCKSMKEAFVAGGDFHSRTAMNMYPYIREAVEQNEVILEWHPQPGQEKPPVPLLKDAFGSERRKAKMLNFSIAYGKTPMGLAKDWKVSVQEARETVDLWYRERQEVLKWQKARKKEALTYGCVHTLLGRARRFPSVDHISNLQKGHIERAAINTPVQGSAADVAMCAMLEINANKRLKELGWKLLLQVHDEVILEGPSESAVEAKALVVECMSKPFNGKNILTVELVVDAKCAQNWYAAK